MGISIEKHQFSITIATAIIVILFVISASFAYGSLKESIVNDIKHNGDQATKNEQHIEILQNSNVEIQVQLASMNTKLTAVETLLTEIKQDIKTYYIR